MRPTVAQVKCPGQDSRTLPQMSLTDSELVAQCRGGQQSAFGDLVLRHQGRLFHSVRQLVRSSEEAQDVCQEAFLQSYQKLGEFEGRSSYYSWLFRIAYNLSINRLRRWSPGVESIDAQREAIGLEPADPHPAGRPDERMLVAERQAVVRRALESLPDDFRTVIVLKEIEGLKYEQIADLVGVPVGTIRSRLHRAREELRQRLAGFMPAGEST